MNLAVEQHNNQAEYIFCGGNKTQKYEYLTEKTSARLCENRYSILRPQCLHFDGPTEELREITNRLVEDKEIPSGKAFLLH